jgi:predicted MPP superfamily phosphohydrolase
MFFVIALSIWAAMNAYVAWRIATIPAVAGMLPRWALIGAALFLAVSYLLARVLESAGFRRTGVALEWIGAEWMGALVIALACFFIADVVTGFGFLLTKHVPAIRAAALVASIILTVVATLNALRPPVVRDFEIRLPGLPDGRDGTVVVALSDLHLGTLLGESWFDARVAQVDALKPDIIVLLGDIGEGDGPAERELPATLGQLRAPLGVWAVPGNHEAHGEGQADAIMKAAGIRLLRDSWGEPAPGLVIAGVDAVGHRPVPGRGLVDRALAGRPEGGATILLSHYPQQVETAAKAKVGLMLAGHTHGGQIWPFDLFVRLQFRYLGGRYEVDGMPLIVCRGTGTWGPRMRLWYPSEILRIVLRS